MFFPERITDIKPGQKVLEVGPGGTPHPRSDVFLERTFDDPQVAKGQRGHAQPLATTKPVVHFDGGRFPFSDQEFDYVICSHVLEHVDDVVQFVGEVCRVGRRGYFEFPTVYYDYLYDFPEHVTLLLWQSGELRWLPKSETQIPALRPITEFFYASLVHGCTAMIDELTPLLVQGFEWHDPVATRRVQRIEDVVQAAATLTQADFRAARNYRRGLVRRWLRRLW